MVGFCPARCNAGDMAGGPQASPRDSQRARALEHSSMQIFILLEEGILYFQFLQGFSAVPSY